MQGGSDEFELKFPDLSQSELNSFQAESSQAGHSNFSDETEPDFFLGVKKKKYYSSQRKPEIE